MKKRNNKDNRIIAKDSKGSVSGGLLNMRAATTALILMLLVVALFLGYTYAWYEVSDGVSITNEVVSSDGEKVDAGYQVYKYYTDVQKGQMSVSGNNQTVSMNQYDKYFLGKNKETPLVFRSVVTGLNPISTDYVKLSIERIAEDFFRNGCADNNGDMYVDNPAAARPNEDGITDFLSNIVKVRVAIIPELIDLSSREDSNNWSYTRNDGTRINCEDEDDFIYCYARDYLLGNINGRAVRGVPFTTINGGVNDVNRGSKVYTYNITTLNSNSGILFPETVSGTPGGTQPNTSVSGTYTSTLTNYSYVIGNGTNYYLVPNGTTAVTRGNKTINDVTGVSQATFDGYGLGNYQWYIETATVNNTEKYRIYTIINDTKYYLTGRYASRAYSITLSTANTQYSTTNTSYWTINNGNQIQTYFQSGRTNYYLRYNNGFSLTGTATNITIKRIDHIESQTTVVNVSSPSETNKKKLYIEIDGLNQTFFDSNARFYVYMLMDYDVDLIDDYALYNRLTGVFDFGSDNTIDFKEPFTIVVEDAHEGSSWIDE